MYEITGIGHAGESGQLNAAIADLPDAEDAACTASAEAIWAKVLVKDVQTGRVASTYAGGVKQPDEHSAARDARRGQLARMSKARLVAMCRAGIAGPDGAVSRNPQGTVPLGAWTKDDLIAWIMQTEFPVEP